MSWTSEETVADCTVLFWGTERTKCQQTFLKGFHAFKSKYKSKYLDEVLEIDKVIVIGVKFMCLCMHAYTMHIYIFMQAIPSGFYYLWYKDLVGKLKGK